MGHLLQGRLIVAVIVTVLVCGAATAGAAALITSADVKNDSLKGEDIKNGTLQSKDVDDGSLVADDLKDGSIGKKKLNPNLLDAIPVRITDALPTDGFSATNASVENTSDGVAFGPYANGGTAGGSLCTDALNGEDRSWALRRYTPTFRTPTRKGASGSTASARSRISRVCGWSCAKECN